MKTEPIVSTDRLAALFGVSRMTISRLARDGVVIRESHGQYRLIPSLQNYLAKLRIAAEARAEPTATENLRVQRLRLIKEKADGVAYANEKIRAEYLWKPDVDETWAQMCREIRAGLRTLPGRIQAKLPRRPELVTALSEEVEEILATLGPEPAPDRTTDKPLNNLTKEN